VAVEDAFQDQDLLIELVRAGVAVRSFAPVTGDLSEAFMRLTSQTPAPTASSVRVEPAP